MEGFRKGILLTLIMSFAVLFLFFGPLIKNPNHVYFAQSGDGFKSYAASIYHLSKDSTLFRSEIQNYPYGEMAFFADCQPMISIPVKLLSFIGIDFRSYLVGIINLSMLLSIVLAALFLFLIFGELKVSWWFAAIASVGICMLSPQIGRLGGHFSLSHLMWLPMLIWLLMKFDRNKSVVYSILIGLTTFLAAGMHMYFFALFGFLFLFYWIYTLSSGQMKLNDFKWIGHFFIQLIVPLLLVQLLTGFNDTVTDRTTHPYGLFVYRAYPATIFLPLHKPYAVFLNLIGIRGDYEWEAFAFIGMVSLIGFLAGIVQMIKRIKRKLPWWKVTENKMMTAFFWASVASLLLSFSIPFNMGLTFLLDYMGPIQQLRALARFSWLFYYLVNILVFVGIFKLIKRGLVMKLIAVSALAFLLYDGYLNVTAYTPQLNNRVAEMDDSANSTPENAWVSILKPDSYQALLPFPYFHVGSENVWLDTKCDIARQSLIVSLKSGLPSMGVALSRTSISQTYKSLELSCIPVSPYRIIKDFPNQKPLLLMVDNCNDLNKSEKNIVNHSSLVWQGPKLSLYSLPVAQMDTIALMGQKAFENEMKPLYEGKIDSSQVLFYNGFETNPTDHAFAGSGAFTGEMENWNHPLEVKLKKGLPGDSCQLLFWVKGFETDLFARSVFEFVQKDGDQVVEYKYDQFQHYFCSLKNGWMRIRIPFVLKSSNDLILLAIRNQDMKKFTLVVDDLLIRKQP
ncbi:MAG TPA: hypothetical protein DCL77_06825 [Prolixibacteraceae bacterium]|jgi:hypothetical protein|nr:hypothetical protein [Prolixibacteraceae bacterium]